MCIYTIQLMTNKKFHMRFGLVPKLTLDDLEWQFCTLFQNTCVLGAHHKNLNEHRPTLSVTQCTLSQKKTTLMLHSTHYRFNPHQPISVIFGRDVAERVCYWMVPPLLTNVCALPSETWTRKLCLFCTPQACVFSWRMWVAACVHAGRPEVVTLNICSNWPVLFRATHILQENVGEHLPLAYWKDTISGFMFPQVVQRH